MLKLSGFAAVILAFILVLENVAATADFIHSGMYGIYIYLTIVSYGLSIAINMVMRNTTQDNWTNLFLGVTVGRLFLTAAFAGIVLYMGVEERVLWVINLFVIYIFYMVFEIIGLIANLRAISAEGENTT